jgi:hypothetical protein
VKKKKAARLVYGDTRDNAAVTSSRAPPSIPLWQWFFVSIASGVTVYWITSKLGAKT